MSTAHIVPSGRSLGSSKKSNDAVNQQLRRLIAQASLCPAGSLERQAIFSEIVQVVLQSRKLWYESSYYYPDALQEMWEYCFLKLDDPQDGYQPDICEVTTWLDDRLKKILRRYRDRSRRQLNRQVFSMQFEDGQVFDPVDCLVSPPDPQPALNIWSDLLNWVTEDPEQQLRNRVCAKYPWINARLLLLCRLPPNQQSWEAIAKRFNADKTYIAQWYSRYCNACLRDWGRMRGYLDRHDP